jgi:hypothetical protein
MKTLLINIVNQFLTYMTIEVKINYNPHLNKKVSQKE